MTTHDDDVSLQQMLEYAREIRAGTAVYNRDEFFADRFRELGLLKLFEMLGEAANRVSDEIKRQHPDLPWRAIIGARNRLSHGYDRVDQEIVWDATQNHIPELIEQLERVIDLRTDFRSGSQT